MTQNDHYSYRVYADPEVARKFDKERFGGAIGELVKQTQEKLVFSRLPEVKGWKVADIGAGTGRLTIPFLELGAEVTACDASQHMLDVLEEKVKNPNLKTVRIDAQQLTFPDRSFDCVLSFRLLMHVVDWKKALAEICRISRDWVVIDLPPRRGFLVLAPIWHRVRMLFSKNVQSYRTFPMQEVKEELRRNEYEIQEIDSGFFLPLVIHRLVGSETFTRSSERLFATTGITRIAGSPCTIFARRTK
jgi:ubiquinone/menaquinone biosynthesis C-methylase UbiE